MLGFKPQRATEPGRLNLKEIYDHRFGREEAVKKDRLWCVLAAYLQRYVPPGAVVLDVACDRGDFIRNITAREKWASDVRNVAQHLTDEVRFVQADGLELERHLPRDYFDLGFMSNYLEHLASTEAVIEQLRVVAQLLKPGGSVMILQPNIRLVGGRYWDFIDHQVGLTERSLAEAATLAGFTTSKIVTRFMPYTTKSRLPQHPALVSAYLKFPPAWFVLGRQTLYIGRRD